MRKEKKGLRRRTERCLAAASLAVGLTMAAWGGPAAEKAEAMLAPHLQIDEYYNTTTGYGEFVVTNYLPGGVYAFAVASNSLDMELTSDSGVGDHCAWAYAVLDEDEWNSYDFTGNWGSAVTDGTGLSVGYNDGSPLWSTIPILPSFEQYFGSSYDQVIIYFTSINVDEYLFNNPINFRETNTFTFAAGMTASPFVAFGADGSVIAYGNTNEYVVPIPGAVWLLGSGLFGLAGIRCKRRRQQSGS